eukprot:2853074-Pyramimonas_sp.AAC.1
MSFAIPSAALEDTNKTLNKLHPMNPNCLYSTDCIPSSLFSLLPIPPIIPTNHGCSGEPHRIDDLSRGVAKKSGLATIRRGRRGGGGGGGGLGGPKTPTPH